MNWEFVVDEDIGQERRKGLSCCFVEPEDSDIAHFRADDGVGPETVDRDMAGANADASAPIVCGMCRGCTTDAPHVDLGRGSHGGGEVGHRGGAGGRGRRVEGTQGGIAIEEVAVGSGVSNGLGVEGAVHGVVEVVANPEGTRICEDTRS